MDVDAIVRSVDGVKGGPTRTVTRQTQPVVIFIRVLDARRARVGKGGDLGRVQDAHEVAQQVARAIVVPARRLVARPVDRATIEISRPCVGLGPARL